LVVSLHGATGSARGQETTSTLSGRGFIALYPQGRGAPASAMWDASPRSSDVLFLATLIDFLHRSGCSSPDRTIVTGFSMGAMVTARLACARPRLARGIAMVAGVLPPLPGCRIPRRTQILIVHGRDDTNVPYDGSLSDTLQLFAGGRRLSDFPGRTRSAMAIDWGRAARCVPGGSVVSRREEVAVRRVRCADGKVVAVTYDRTGHAWDSEIPSVRATSSRIVRFFTPLRPR
jgi:poly(3-hydroxybutyrate) depolymerase